MKGSRGPKLTSKKEQRTPAVTGRFRSVLILLLTSNLWILLSRTGTRSQQRSLKVIGWRIDHSRIKLIPWKTTAWSVCNFTTALLKISILIMDRIMVVNCMWMLDLKQVKVAQLRFNLFLKTLFKSNFVLRLWAIWINCLVCETGGSIFYRSEFNYNYLRGNCKKLHVDMQFWPEVQTGFTRKSIYS